MSNYLHYSVQMCSPTLTHTIQSIPSCSFARFYTFFLPLLHSLSALHDVFNFLPLRTCFLWSPISSVARSCKKRFERISSSSQQLRRSVFGVLNQVFSLNSEKSMCERNMPFSVVFFEGSPLPMEVSTSRPFYPLKSMFTFVRKKV